jgi:hypothetical protein
MRRAERIVWRENNGLVHRRRESEEGRIGTKE